MRSKVGLCILGVLCGLAGGGTVMAQTPAPTPKQQVLIECFIWEMNKDYSSDMGVQWVYNPPTAALPSPDQKVWIKLPAFDNSTEYRGANISGDIMDLRYGMLTSTIQAIINEGKGVLHSKPSIIVRDGETAQISTEEQIPYLNRKIAGTVEVVLTEFVKSGIELNVTPTIINSGTEELVEMKINPKVSAVVRYKQEGKFLLPIVQTREAQTDVIIRARDTFILGGLLRDNQQTVNNAIPVVSKIPLLGNLFKSKSVTTNQSELFISVTPIVLAADEKYVLPTEDLETIPEKGNAKRK